MNCCKQFEDKIWEAVENGTCSRELMEHTIHCNECRQALDALTAAKAGFAVLRGVQAPDPRDAVRARLNNRKQRWQPIPAFMIGAACVIVLLILFAGRMQKADVPVVYKQTAKHSVKRIEQKPIAQAPSPEVKIVRSKVIASSPKPKYRRRVISSHIYRRVVQQHQKPDQYALKQDQPKPQESNIDKPCPQVTTVVLREDPAVELPVRPANPNYCCATLPIVKAVPNQDPHMIP